MAEAEAPRVQYPILDIMRFFAALLVATLHLVGTNAKDNFWLHFFPAGQPFRPFYPHTDGIWFIGFIGVQIFFAISGYIICISATRSSSALEFFKNRLLRILPALWICTIIAFLIYAIYDVFPLPELAVMFTRSVFLVPFGPYLDGVVWTIIVEMAFYFAICLYIGCFGKDRLLVFGYILVSASTIFWLLIAFYPALEGKAVLMQIARRLLLEHGAFFGTGLILALWGEKSARRSNLVFLAMATVPTFLQIRSSATHVFSDLGSHGAPSDPYVPFIIWLFAALLLYASTLLAQQGRFRRNHAAIRKLGLMTYPLYLLHYTVGYLLYALSERFLDVPIYINTIIAIAGAIAGAFLISQFAEDRIRNLLRGPLTRVWAYLDLWSAGVFGAPRTMRSSSATESQKG